MSLLGIDVGTTGCKVVAFADDGTAIAAAYREYDISRPRPGWDELDAGDVWRKAKSAISEVAGKTARDPIRALAVSSLGEATVPVRLDRAIVGPSMLLSDNRGEEYLPELSSRLAANRLYEINGNTLGNHYSLTKLLWLSRHQPAIYERAERFLHWSGFIAFMLGAAPHVDYSLANRTLLFDVNRQAWSPELLAWAGLDAARLPTPVPSGTVVGEVGHAIARELGLPPGVAIVSGAHDQCANAVGCGVISGGSAVYGMGTFHCITPVFSQRRDAALMIERGLNTEHHAIPGCYVSFIYNQGGSLVKWYRNTFAAAEHRQAQAAGQDVYDSLFAELPDRPSSVLVLPHFTATGPPDFITDSSGVVLGLHLDTSRGDVLKGILEGSAFYLKQCIDALPPTGIAIADYRAVGGGSKSDAWVQLCADVFGRPFLRPQVTEAGALGAAMIAGVGRGVFSSYADAVDRMVKPDKRFEPQTRNTEYYAERCAQYARLWPLLGAYLREDSHQLAVRRERGA